MYYILDCGGIRIGVTATNPDDAVTIAQKAHDDLASCECFEGVPLPRGVSLIGWQDRKHTVTTADIVNSHHEPDGR